MRPQDRCSRKSDAIVVLLAHVLMSANCSEIIDIRLGGLFKTKTSDEALMFKYAIDRANNDMPHGYSLSYDIHETAELDSFSLSKIVCSLTKSGVAAIFGPANSALSDYVSLTCSALEIPHIQLHPYRFSSIEDHDFTIRLFPSYDMLSTALAEYIHSLKWQHFVLIYERNEALSQLQELFNHPEFSQSKIILHKLVVRESIDGVYSSSLKDLYKSSQVRQYVLHCDDENVVTILKQATDVHLLSEYSHLLLTTLNVGSIDMTQLPKNIGNLTAFQLINTSNPLSMAVLQEFRHKHTPTVIRNITTEAALVYDGVQLFVNALKELLLAQDVHMSSLSCNPLYPTPWQHGESLLNYIRTTTLQQPIKGMTGDVFIDHQRGMRIDYSFMLLELTPSLEWREIGTWSQKYRLNITKQFSDSLYEAANSLKGKTIRVTTILEEPYVMLVKNDTTLTGNARFQGFCIDILKKMAERLEFNYTINPVTEYGIDNNGTWNGMVGELINLKADIAVASLTITSQREEVISFTMPFMNLGINILIKKPSPRPPEPFSFLNPLSKEIWLYTITAYAAVTCFMFILARFSPYEWNRPKRCVLSQDDKNVVDNQFGFINSMWFTIGSLMQQGSDVCPRAASTRIASASWWFFTLILVASYTANLAAFLTIDRMIYPISSADDLIKDKNFQFGTRANGATMAFFKKSQVPTYKLMWDMMNANKSVFVNSTAVAINRVKEGNYAFLLESTQNEYITQRNCDLIGVGGQLDSKHYGFGTPQNSRYRDLWSQAILKLKEDQVIEQLKNYWWKQHGIEQPCEENTRETSNAHALQLKNVAGIFFILIAGIVLAFCVAGCEYVKLSSKSPNKATCSQCCKDLTFSMRHPGVSYKAVTQHQNNEENMESEVVFVNHANMNKNQQL